MISELTEISEPAEAVPFRGWIFYDRDCNFCRELALRFENVFAERGFYFEPLQEDWVLRRLNLTREQALKEMRVLTAGGEVLSVPSDVLPSGRSRNGCGAFPFAESPAADSPGRDPQDGDARGDWNSARINSAFRRRAPCSLADPNWLDRNGRDDSRPALWIVRVVERRLARAASRCSPHHGATVALHVG